MHHLIAFTTTIALVAFFAAVYRRKRHLMRFLISRETKTHLSISPTSISIEDVALVLTSILVKYISQSVGLLPSLASVNTAQNEAGASPTIPDMILSMPLRLEKNALTAYFAAVRPEAHDSPTTIGPREMSLLLCAITQPAMLLLLGKQSCPVQPLGSVNVRNRFEFARPDLCNIDRLKDLSKRGLLFVVARPLPETRAVKRGYECDFVVELRCIEFRLDATKNAGESTVLFKQVFTMLQFAKTNAKKAVSEVGEKKAPERIVESFDLQLEASAPSKWAAACKDYNPIHIFPPVAKILGFPGKLAHGNLAVARGLETILRNQVSALVEVERQSQPIWIETEFRRPIVVPARLSIKLFETAWKDQQPVIAFDVCSKDKVNVECRMGILSKG